MATTSDENLQLNHAAPAPHDSTTTKRQRLSDAAASSHAIGRVFDVEILLRGLLTLLDLPSLTSFLEVLALDESWRQVLTNETLWKEMLMTHFGGKLPPAEQFNDEVSESEEDDEPQLILMEDDIEADDDVSLMGDDEENEDDESDVMDLAPTTSRQISRSESVAETRLMTVITWMEGMPSEKVLEVACPDLKDFLSSAEQLVQFESRVQIIRGDIGEIETVGSQRLDGLAFPTASSMRNPHTGAASVIFRRAGQGLSDHVRTLNAALDLGAAHVTPGFDAGVAKLIHCVGPSGFNINCLRDLQRTYRNVLRCIQEENLSCVAIVSISTGNMGMPVDNAAWFALCVIQRYMRSTNWTATIGIVCFEEDVYTAFNKSKTKLLTQFNAESVRAIPPLRNRSSLLEVVSV